MCFDKATLYELMTECNLANDDPSAAYECLESCIEIGPTLSSQLLKVKLMTKKAKNRNDIIQYTREVFSQVQVTKSNQRQLVHFMSVLCDSVGPSDTLSLLDDLLLQKGRSALEGGLVPEGYDKLILFQIHTMIDHGDAIYGADTLLHVSSTLQSKLL